MGLSDILILYGSQTGTAEDVAERVARNAYHFSLSPSLYPMNSITSDELHLNWKGEEKIVIFVCATTGQGDTPDNMKIFWKQLCRRSLVANIFSGVNYGVIALGDSSYAKYNFVGKKLFKRMLQLGANAVTDICLGDDQHDLGPDAEIDPWLNNLWNKFVPVSNRNGSDINSTHIESKFYISVEPDDGNICDSRNYEDGIKMEFRNLIENKRCTHPSHFQDSRLITFDWENSSFKYDPGDVLMVLPDNLESNIEKFFCLFPGINRTDQVFIRKNPKFKWVSIPVYMQKKLGPLPWSWENIVRSLLDIQSIPRRYFFELLSKITPNELEKEKLDEFSRPEGQQDLFSYCNRPKRNILEILQDFRHATENIPPDLLFDLIPIIKPRSFSIASSMRAFPSAVQILVAVVKYSTKLAAPRYGLCSNWLASLPIGSPALLWIDKGSFRFPPKEQNSVVIMVGPGTGCAPFRSFISENFDSKNKLVLFFGCRNEDMDYYFKDEWTHLQTEGCLKLATAFSRPTTEQNCTKQYVQQQIKKHELYLRSVVLNGITPVTVYIYVAGNAKQMPIDVFNAFADIFKEDFVKNLHKIGKYQTEVWS